MGYTDQAKTKKLLEYTLKSPVFSKAKHFNQFNNRNAYLDMNYPCTD